MGKLGSFASDLCIQGASPTFVAQSPRLEKNTAK